MGRPPCFRIRVHGLFGGVLPMCGGAEYDCTGRRAGGARLRCRSAGTLLVDTPQQCLRRRSRHPRAVGLWTAAGGVALAAGPILEGFLVQFLGWRSIFLVNLPVGLAGVWLTLRFLSPSEPEAERRGLDLIGQGIAALALLGIIGTIIEAGSSGWHAPITVCGLILGVTAGLAFIVVERTTATRSYL